MADRLDEARRLLADAVGAVFPSAQLLVVDGGEAVLDEAAGDCTRATVFDLASLTKALCTTTLVMRHLDAGALSLDDEPRPGVPLGLLLSHAGGLPAWRPFYERLSGAPDPKRAIVEAARAEPLEAPPGSRSVYSDLGFLLVGDAVERAGGAPLDAQWAALGFAATFHPAPAACAPTEGGLRGVVHDDNARAMGGVAGHAGLFGTARDVAAIAYALLGAWHGAGAASIARPATVRRFWSPSGIAGSTWCLGWDRPAPIGAGASSAGSLWPRDGVGHLGFTGCSLWIDPPRRRFVVLLSNRVYPSRANEAIKQLRPALHDAIVRGLDGGSGPGA